MRRRYGESWRKRRAVLSIAQTRIETFDEAVLPRVIEVMAAVFAAAEAIQFCAALTGKFEAFVACSVARTTI